MTGSYAFPDDSVNQENVPDRPRQCSIRFLVPLTLPNHGYLPELPYQIPQLHRLHDKPFSGNHRLRDRTAEVSHPTSLMSPDPSIFDHS